MSCEEPPDGTGVPVELIKIEYDDSRLTNVERKYYWEEAYRQSINHLIDNDIPLKNEIELANEYVDQFYSALVSVFNSDFAERDLVIDTFKIKPFRDVHPYRFVIFATEDIEWVKKWKNGNKQYIIDQINPFINQYEFDLFYVREWYSGAVHLTFESTVLINIEAFTNFLEKQGVWGYIFPYTYSGDGDDITILFSDFFIIKFKLGWGDCLAGCTATHYWEFIVDFNGKVEFLKSYGSPLSTYR